MASKKVKSGKEYYKLNEGFGKIVVTRLNGLASKEIGTAKTEVEALNIVKSDSGSNEIKFV
jgi:hypothetical protein